jgi:hypothetical protein
MNNAPRNRISSPAAKGAAVNERLHGLKACPVYLHLIQHDHANTGEWERIRACLTCVACYEAALLKVVHKRSPRGNSNIIHFPASARVIQLETAGRRVVNNSYFWRSQAW